MNWIRFGMTVLAAGIGVSLTDWLFGGVLFHEKYKAYPEIWRRPEGGAGETRAITWAMILGFWTCLSFVYLCACLNLHTYMETTGLALAIWLIAPLPIIITNALWIKLHPLVVVSNSIGWLVKLIVAGVAVGLIFH